MDLPEPGGPQRINGLRWTSHDVRVSTWRTVSSVVITTSEAPTCAALMCCSGSLSRHAAHSPLAASTSSSMSETLEPKGHAQRISWPFIFALRGSALTKVEKWNAGLRRVANDGVQRGTTTRGRCQCRTSQVQHSPSSQTHSHPVQHTHTASKRHGQFTSAP